MGKEGERDSQSSPGNVEPNPLDTTMDIIRGFVQGLKPALVSSLSWADTMSSSLRQSSLAGSVTDDAEAAVLGPFKEMKLKIDIEMYFISEYINSEHKFVSSLARSHPIQLVGSASIGMGILCAAPLRLANLPGSGKVFRFCTLLALPTSIVFTKLVQLKWKH
jgi:hypothetical protein